MDVISSAIEWVEYHDDQAALDVHFYHGATYRYLEVPREVFDEFMVADSKGAYFVANIKDDYEHERL